MTWIKLTPRERDEAWAYHEEVLAKVVKKGPNYTGLETPTRFFDGRLGEIGLRKWANKHGLIFEETVRNDGESDMQDFIFQMKSKPARVNIKTTLAHNGIRLMHPVAQTYKIEKQDLLIGARGEDNGSGMPAIIEMWGVIPVRQFLAEAKTQTFRVPSRVILLQDLPYSMDRFRRSCKRR